ncbi:MAG: D-amino acid aminotransferase [Deltaproteobacteria bacterium]|nr:D-amino acid aminotransferase [Deltaproteobacteria bacterium]
MSGQTSNGIVYLNGKYLPVEQANVNVLDRGFIFGDGIYEVLPAYDSKPFRVADHLARMGRSLEGVMIANPLTPAQWEAVFHQLIEANGGGDLSIYIQISRGVAKRDHVFPANVTPTVLVVCTPLAPPPAAWRETGMKCALREDIRWQRCDIKSISLLGNLLMRHQATLEGANETILVRDGFLTEGSSSNVFVVKNGKAATPPKNNLILSGITREVTVELAPTLGIPCEERAVSQQELLSADEIWVASSFREVAPVCWLDGKKVGNGLPGPLWKKIWDGFQAYKRGQAALAGIQLGAGGSAQAGAPHP